MQGLLVEEFYRDSVILITGATGFFGQVLLEKILRSLQPRKIYLAIRKKRNVNAQRRMQELWADPIFEKVRRSDLMNLVEILEVDFERENLSLNKSLCENLTNEINVVFNLVASVNFTDPIRTALNVNVEYTRNLLQLVSTFHCLKAVIHVSTFYSNCNQATIEEKIYKNDRFGGYDNLKKILNPLSSTEETTLTPFVLGDLPNSYVFSKNLAESMINDHFSHLPIGIFRPPQVTSTYREPFPGWYNNFNGAAGLMLAVNSGLVHVIPFDPEKKFKLAPVDYCVNATLCCAVDVFRNHHPKLDNIQVYNFTDACAEPKSGDVYATYLKGMSPFRRYVFGRILLVLSQNRFIVSISYALMRLRGIAIDWIYARLGKKQRMAVTMEKLINMMEVLKYFCVREWNMDNRNMQAVIQSLGSEEAALFPCNLKDVNWDEHLEGFVPGVIKYALEPRLKRAKTLAIIDS